MDTLFKKIESPEELKNTLFYKYTLFITRVTSKRSSLSMEISYYKYYTKYLLKFTNGKNIYDYPKYPMFVDRWNSYKDLLKMYNIDKKDVKIIVNREYENLTIY